AVWNSNKLHRFPKANLIIYNTVLIAGIWGAARTAYQPALVGRGKARCHMSKHRYVSSPPPFRTVREAFTSHGSTLSDQSQFLLCGVRCRVPEGFPGGRDPLGV